MPKTNPQFKQTHYLNTSNISAEPNSSLQYTNLNLTQNFSSAQLNSFVASFFTHPSIFQTKLFVPPPSQQFDQDTKTYAPKKPRPNLNQTFLKMPFFLQLQLSLLINPVSFSKSVSIASITDPIKLVDHKKRPKDFFWKKWLIV